MIFGLNLSEKMFLFVCLGGPYPDIPVYFILFREVKYFHVADHFTKAHVFNVLKLLILNIFDT